jgi:hypothetical protein
MRHRFSGQMMAVTLRQLLASTSSILILGSVWGFPSIIEMSVRKYKLRLISEVLLIVSEDTIIQIKKFIVFKYQLLQIGLPRDKIEIDGPVKIQMASGFI